MPAPLTLPPSDYPVDNENEYREVWLTSAVDLETEQVQTWAQEVITSLAPSRFTIEVHTSDLHLIPVSEGEARRGPRHRLKKIVHIDERYIFLLKHPGKHEQVIAADARCMAEQMRQQMLDGDGEGIRVYQIPPGLKDLYLPILQKVLEE